MADDQKQRERKTGSKKVPERERNTSERTATGAERPSATGSAEREHTDTSFTPGERERVTGERTAPRGATLGRERPSRQGPSPSTHRDAVTQPKELTGHQREMLASAFQDTARANQLKTMIGSGERQRGDDEPTAVSARFDGVTPAPELTGRDLFKTIHPPVQSREGRRSGKLLEQVLKQFAVANNPRYAPDGPAQTRAHIFVWDVSRAMSCEVPHFLGVKELNCFQTVDWVRHEGHSRGWTRSSADDALSSAKAGQLVIAMPREARIKQLAIVLPSRPDPDGKPRVASAAMTIGADLSLFEALGVYAVEYFAHA